MSADRHDAVLRTGGDPRRPAGSGHRPDEDDQVTTVVFRRWRNGSKEVIAIFPEIKEGGWGVRLFSHVGQHWSAAYGRVILMTRPALAIDEDVVALKEELEGRGYRLKVRQRWTEPRRRTR